MKEKFSIQNIIIIVLLITIVALLVEPKLKSNTISEISDEISTDSTTIDDTLSMRDWLLNKGYSEKEIEILSGSQKFNNESEGENGRYQLQLVQAFGWTTESSSNEFYPIILVLDTKTGECHHLYDSYWGLKLRNWKSKRIEIK